MGLLLIQALQVADIPMTAACMCLNALVRIKGGARH
jgi:hypothetical protein